MVIVRRLAVLFLVLAAAPTLWAQSQPAGAPAATTANPTAGASGPAFDVKATTAPIWPGPADKKARSDAYFEGGYWLLLWDFLLSSAILVSCCTPGCRRACATWRSESRAGEAFRT